MKKKNVFDESPSTYEDIVNENISMSGLDITFFTKLKIDEFRRRLPSLGIGDNPRILDFGCGVGETLKYLKDLSNDVCGFDISLESADLAAKRNPEVSIFSSLKELKKEKEFDIIVIVNVLHHVPPEEREEFSTQCRNLLRSGGWIFVFEHNPLNPATRYIVSNCEEDKDASLLNRRALDSVFSSRDFQCSSVSYIGFFPFRPKLFRVFERFMFWIPFGAQFCYLVQKK
ncbi:conserved hypothetical protein [Halobacteriovorax marinus SJ]|uniref:Methyltransferase domain-containing protein n=1 Tax=Halobacteriovorax marinus (strain ATCC BAA-682 / DSM 15412 / SJ) TaxID=862908 RepID=E1X3G2_HALMS|nr:class I SAM-dependent methyltransferase [Halobacteriovorax marinus]CBW25257.1 conserved hypothetical protein [Halobacteriovorax marinus SJ]